MLGIDVITAFAGTRVCVPETTIPTRREAVLAQVIVGEPDVVETLSAATPRIFGSVASIVRFELAAVAGTLMMKSVDEMAVSNNEVPLAVAGALMSKCVASVTFTTRAFSGIPSPVINVPKESPVVLFVVTVTLFNVVLLPPNPVVESERMVVFGRMVGPVNTIPGTIPETDPGTNQGSNAAVLAHLTTLLFTVVLHAVKLTPPVRDA